MSGQVGQIDGGCKIAAKGCICNSTIRRINLRIKVQNRQGDVYPPDPVNASVINNIIKRLAAGPGDIVPGFAAARTAYEVRTKINVGTDYRRCLRNAAVPGIQKTYHRVSSWETDFTARFSMVELVGVTCLPPYLCISAICVSHPIARCSFGAARTGLFPRRMSRPGRGQRSRE